MHIKHQIVLASSSKYRKHLLQNLIPTFECYSPNIDETILIKENGKQESASNLVKRLAKNKASRVSNLYPNKIIIASDQCAQIINTVSEAPISDILNKPGTKKNAVSQLSSCSGKRVRFYTGLCIINIDGSMLYELDTFDVNFKVLSAKTIQQYCEIETPYDCAGSFKCEGLGIALFNSLHGKDPNSLIGLPLISLTSMLGTLGVDVISLMHAAKFNNERSRFTPE